MKKIIFFLKRFILFIHPHIWKYSIINKIMFNERNKKIKIPFIRKKCIICKEENEKCVFLLKTGTLKKVT